MTTHLESLQKFIPEDHYRLKQILRAYRAHCSVTELILREKNEQRIVSEACRIMVEIAGYRLAWIGDVLHDPARSVKPIAQAGLEEGYIEKLWITWADTERGRGPTGRAIRTGQPQLSQHIISDLDFRPWREEAIRHGYRSSAAFPLIRDGQVFGVLGVYAPEPDAFTPEEVLTLQELSEVISFGIVSRRVQQERDREFSRANHKAAELRTVLDTITESVFVCDPQARIVIANRSALDLLEIPAPESLAPDSWAIESGFLPKLLPNAEPPPSDGCPLSRALRGEMVQSFSEEVRPANHSRSIKVRTSAAPIRDSDGKILGAVKVVRDVTDLAQFERMKDEFIGTAAHELKTPVTVMKGYTQILLRKTRELPEFASPMLKSIDEGADRIHRIILDLLDISQLHLGTFEIHKQEVDLTELVAETVSGFAARSSKHKVVLTRSEPARISGDRPRLQQVLSEIIDNAIRYSPQGGLVEVQLRREDEDAVVSVKDNGIGIPKERQGWIFRCFYRAHTGTPFDYGGMGVGLYLSREIIQRLGGSIGFSSEEGRGSTFFFKLPLLASAKGSS